MDKQVDAQVAQATGAGAVTAPTREQPRSARRATSGRRRPPRQAARRSPATLTILSFMSPWIIGFTVFFGYPLVTTVYLSFDALRPAVPPRWIGLANYRFMGKDPNFWPGVRNTLWMIVIAVPVTVVFAFCVALTGQQGAARSGLLADDLLPADARATGRRHARLRLPLQREHRTGEPDPRLLHLPQPLWFDDPHWAKPSLTLLAMWGIGTIMIIFLASLLDVPAQLYEAADLDGANAWQRLRPRHPAHR